MTRPRLSIRRLMLALVALAILLRLALVTAAVVRQPNAHTLSHLRRFRGDGSPFVHSHGTTASQYWSETWRRFLGARWPGGSACSCKAGFEAETGRQTIDVETSHDMGTLERRMNEL